MTCIIYKLHNRIMHTLYFILVKFFVALAHSRYLGKVTKMESLGVRQILNPLDKYVLKINNISNLKGFPVFAIFFKLKFYIARFQKIYQALSVRQNWIIVHVVFSYFVVTFSPFSCIRFKF